MRLLYSIDNSKTNFLLSLIIFKFVPSELASTHSATFNNSTSFLLLPMAKTYTCDFKSAVSKDAGHSIDLRGVKIISQENHLLSRKITLVNKHSYSATGNEP